jgi:transcriptional pleiotropic regulator of transition state genes
MKGFNKKISKTGAVTIPAALRREYGLTGGERFNIAVENDGSIRLQRTQGSCLFDGSDENLIIFDGRFVCSRCVERMTAAVQASKGGAVE